MRVRLRLRIARRLRGRGLVAGGRGAVAHGGSLVRLVQAASKASREMEESTTERAVERAVQAVLDAMDAYEKDGDVSVLIAAQERARRVVAHMKDVEERKE